MRKGVLAEQEHARGVDGQNLVPGAALEVLARPVGVGEQYPGVVVEHVQAAQNVDSRLYDGRHLRFVTHIGSHADGGGAAVTQLGREVLDAAGIQIGYRQRGPLGSKTATHGGALTAHRAGYQAAPTFEPLNIHRFPPPSIPCRARRPPTPRGPWHRVCGRWKCSSVSSRWPPAEKCP